MITTEEAMRIAKESRLGIMPEEGGMWRARLANGQGVGPPAASPEEALEGAKTAMLQGDARQELLQLRQMLVALDRGRYFARPVLSGPAGQQVLTFTVVRRNGIEVRTGVETWLQAAAIIRDLDAEDAAAQQQSKPSASTPAV